MRAIKFRAWFHGKKRMVYNLGFDHDSFKSIEDTLNMPCVWDLDTCDASGDYEGAFSYELMQYTGLKDKNGREIYEGDVVVQGGYIWFDEGKPNYRGTVEWVYSQWQVIAYCVNPKKRGISDGMNYGFNDEGFDEGENSYWEVIGNIHDNPELLEVAK